MQHVTATICIIIYRNTGGFQSNTIVLTLCVDLEVEIETDDDVQMIFV